MSDFKQNKLEKEAQKNWDLFYTTNVFKDRHWTTPAELLFDNCEVSLSIFDRHMDQWLKIEMI